MIAATAALMVLGCSESTSVVDIGATGGALSEQGELGQDTYRLTWDDFKDGFSIGQADSKWFYFGAGPYVGNGGTATTSAQGLRVVSDGTNAATGEPAFSNTLAQEDENGGLPGGLDHVKWLVYMNHLSSKGYPGFDAEDGKELSCEAWIGGRTYGTELHPFGSNVPNPNDDLRLASFAINTIDFETFMVFDFFMTNETIYAFYERLPFGRGPALGNYAAFSYAIPVAANEPGKINHLKIAYDRAAGTVRWLIDGEEVFKVDQVGFRLDSRDFLTIDHGGTEGPITLDQMNCGMGMFTLLDAYLPSEVGLVRLSIEPYFYFEPPLGEPNLLDFVDNDSLLSSRLFGQGAELNARRYVVSSIPSP